MGLTARTGATRAGLPISISRAPPADLLAYVGRFYVTVIDQPAHHVAADILLNETAMVRVLVRGDHAWQVPNRGWCPEDGARLFGAQRRAMPVRVTGATATAGFVIRPGGWFTFDDRPADFVADRIVALSGDLGAALCDACADIDDAESTIDRLVAAVRLHVARRAVLIDSRIEWFEQVARTAPSSSVAAAATTVGLSVRTFDTLIRRHFGHLPKTVLRRSRFLDLAAVMRGLQAHPDDGDVAARFYDPSHVNREFRQFVDMAPTTFRHAVTPLLTPGLELRQRRKMEELALLGPGETPPWRAAE